MQQTRSQALNRFYARRRMCELLEEKTLGTQKPRGPRTRPNPQTEIPPRRKTRKKED